LRKYVLDSNIYITAARDAAFAGELIRFTGQHLPRLYLHSVVVQELYRGAVNDHARQVVDRQIVAPFENRGRIFTPSYAAWKRSGEVVAELVKRKIVTAGGVPHSMVNDILLAVSCREEGVVLITLNDRGFGRIQQVEQLSYVLPWPK
jgi:predicted nucleic acid-binding protein